MGGELTCQSTPGTGSTFAFAVTLSLPDALPLATDAAAPHAMAEAVVGRVLVAEDNRINQVIATRLLESLGITVDVVGDGAAAVQAVRQRHYDVVLLDCQMPILDGYDAAKQIRADEPKGRHVPMLAVTASVMPEDHERARAAGVDAVLMKPLRADELRQAVLRHLPRTRRISQAIVLPTTSTELPVLEVATLADLKRAGGLATVHAVVAIFEDAALQTRAELHAASRDRELLMLLAHRQRGTAACVGARRLAASLSQLETIARSASDGELDAALLRIDRETESALRVLERYRNADSAVFMAAPAN
jgi:CheY-like chemotaxis protein/HPt (histidine-containing phosphotransfer) domain-containing protein